MQTDSQLTYLKKKKPTDSDVAMTFVTYPLLHCPLLKELDNKHIKSTQILHDDVQHTVSDLFEGT